MLQQLHCIPQDLPQNPVKLRSDLVLKSWNEPEINEIELLGAQPERDPFAPQHICCSPFSLMAFEDSIQLVRTNVEKLSGGRRVTAHNPIDNLVISDFKCVRCAQSSRFRDQM